MDINNSYEYKNTINVYSSINYLHLLYTLQLPAINNIWIIKKKFKKFKKLKIYIYMLLTSW